MRRADFERDVALMRSLKEKRISLHQSEGVLSWYPQVDHGELYAILNMDLHGVRVSSNILRRALAVREALDAWERNEGEWPIGQAPTP